MEPPLPVHLPHSEPLPEKKIEGELNSHYLLRCTLPDSLLHEVLGEDSPAVHKKTSLFGLLYRVPGGATSYFNNDLDQQAGHTKNMALDMGCIPRWPTSL